MSGAKSIPTVFPCIKCGTKGHVGRDCPSGGGGGGVAAKNCLLCGKSGHLHRECPSSSRRACIHCHDEVCAYHSTSCEEGPASHVSSTDAVGGSSTNGEGGQTSPDFPEGGDGDVGCRSKGGEDEDSTSRESHSGTVSIYSSSGEEGNEKSSTGEEGHEKSNCPNPAKLSDACGEETQEETHEETQEYPQVEGELDKRDAESAKETAENQALVEKLAKKKEELQAKNLTIHQLKILGRRFKDNLEKSEVKLKEVEEELESLKKTNDEENKGSTEKEGVEAMKLRIAELEKTNAALVEGNDESKTKPVEATERFQTSDAFSFVDFTKSLHKTMDRSDVEFVFPLEDSAKVSGQVGGASGSSLDDAPKSECTARRVKAHSLVLSHYSPEFTSLLCLHEKEGGKVTSVPIEKWSYEGFKAFIKGIYWGFTDVDSRKRATKELFNVTQEFKVSKVITQNLFTVHNVWTYLEHALVHSDRDAVLWHKFNRMLTINRVVYMQIAMTEKRVVSRRTMAHILALPRSPLSRPQLLGLVNHWCGHLDVNNNKHKDAIAEIQSAATLALSVRVDQFLVDVVYVASDVHPTFTIEYVGGTGQIDRIIEQISFVTGWGRTEIAFEWDCVQYTHRAHKIESRSDPINPSDEIHIHRVVSITIVTENGAKFDKMPVRLDTPLSELKEIIVRKASWHPPSPRSFSRTDSQSHSIWLGNSLERLDETKKISDYDWKNDCFMVVRAEYKWRDTPFTSLEGQKRSSTPSDSRESKRSKQDESAASV